MVMNSIPSSFEKRGGEGGRDVDLYKHKDALKRKVVASFFLDFETLVAISAISNSEQERFEQERENRVREFWALTLTLWSVIM